MALVAWFAGDVGPSLGSWRWLGIAVGIAGAALTMSGAGLFSRLGTNIHTFNDPDLLVEAGPFRWTRNPMYLGFTLLLTGVALLLDSVLAFIGPAAFLVAADRWYIPFEERRLRATFGPAYAEYASRVHRWIGRTRTPAAAKARATRS